MTSDHLRSKLRALSTHLREADVRYMICRALFLAAQLGLLTSAQAGAGTITTVVSPLSPTVTYSLEASPSRPPLVTYIGYSVSITNAGGNTINSVRFTATASATDPDEIVTFSSAEGVTCSATNAELTSIECMIGQLRGGQSVPTFAVFFRAPVKDSSTPLPDGNPSNCAATACVALSGVTWYAEGTNDASPPSPPNSSVAWAAMAVTLGTFNPEVVITAVPASGGTYFTGDGAVTRPSDTFASLVAIPPLPNYSSIELLESDVSTNINCSSLKNFHRCYQSAVTIPGVAFSGTSGKFLTFVFRTDKSSIRAGSKIERVLIQYVDANANRHNVGLCAGPTTPRTDGVPCIAARKHYKNKQVLGWTPDLDGDFEWTLINLNNGRFELF